MWFHYLNAVPAATWSLSFRTNLCAAHCLLTSSLLGCLLYDESLFAIGVFFEHTYFLTVHGCGEHIVQSVNVVMASCINFCKQRTSFTAAAHLGPAWRCSTKVVQSTLSYCIWISWSHIQLYYRGFGLLLIKSMLCNSIASHTLLSRQPNTFIVTGLSWTSTLHWWLS